MLYEVITDDSKVNSETVIEALDKLLAGVEGFEITFSQEESALSSILGTDEAPVVIEVRGTELDEIESVINQVKEKSYNFV